MAAITTPGQINYFTLCTLRAGIKCEQQGMRLSRGQSVTKMAKERYGIVGNRAIVLAKVQELIENHPDRPQP